MNGHELPELIQQVIQNQKNDCAAAAGAVIGSALPVAISTGGTPEGKSGKQLKDAVNST